MEEQGAAGAPQGGGEGGAGAGGMYEWEEQGDNNEFVQSVSMLGVVWILLD